MVLFPADRASWLPGSRRIRTARPATDGAFTFRGMPPGDYYLGALTDLEPGEWNDPTLLGQLLETFVLQELRRQASWHDDPIAFHHFRDKDGVEVDIVLERGAHDLAGVEVKAGATVTGADFRGLRKLQEATGPRFAAGLVLYDGEITVSFGDRLYAVPIRTLWETA